MKAGKKGVSLGSEKASIVADELISQRSQQPDPFKSRAKKGLLPKGPSSLLKEGMTGLAIKHGERVHGMMRQRARKRREKLGISPKSGVI
jgi:hypothetical protein